jgi:hypothetical protein
MALPRDFFAKDRQGFAGGVEAAFMSTTTAQNVANQYSGAAGGAESGEGLRTVFRYLVGERSLGADVSWLSQFSTEKEVLYPPATHLQIVGEPRLDETGVSVITVRPTVSQRSKTLEQVERGRCEGLLQLGASLVSDVRFCARNHAVWELCKDLLDGQAAAVTQEVRGRAATAYNDNETYGTTMLRLIDMSEVGRKAVAERVREEAVGRWKRGDREGALEHMRKAIAVMEELCANDKARLDRLAAMRGELVGIHGDSGVGAAKAKNDMAFHLIERGEYEKALELANAALGIYQAELSGEVPGLGCSAGSQTPAGGRSGCNLFDKVPTKVCICESCTGLSMQRWCGEAEGVEAILVAQSGKRTSFFLPWIVRPPLHLLDLRRRQVRGGVEERWRRVLTLLVPGCCRNSSSTLDSHARTTSWVVSTAGRASTIWRWSS